METKTVVRTAVMRLSAAHIRPHETIIQMQPKTTVVVFFLHVMDTVRMIQHTMSVKLSVVFSKVEERFVRISTVALKPALVFVVSTSHIKSETSSTLEELAHQWSQVQTVQETVMSVF